MHVLPSIRTAVTAICAAATVVGGLVAFTPSGDNPVSADYLLAAAEPVLGSSQGRYSEGYGEVRPEMITENSMCANVIHSITWDSWGGETAHGTGLQCLGAAETENPPVYDLVATDLGSCNGTLAYRKLTITFESGNSSSREICGQPS